MTVEGGAAAAVTVEIEATGVAVIAIVRAAAIAVDEPKAPMIAPGVR